MELPHYEIVVTLCSTQITAFELFEGLHLFHLHPFGFLGVLIILGFKGKGKPFIWVMRRSVQILYNVQQRQAYMGE